MKLIRMDVNDQNAQVAVLAVGGTIDRAKHEVIIPDEAIASREEADQRTSPGGKYYNNHMQIILSSGVKLLEEHSEVGNYLEIDRWSK